jgi:hypothetical protein
VDLVAILNMPDRLLAYYELVNVYAAGPERVRRDIIEGWDYGVEWQYPNPHRIACSKTESAPPKEQALASLIYYAVASAVPMRDIRDMLVGLAVVYNAGRLAGLDVDRIFEDAAAVSPGGVRTELQRFVRRSDHDKSLEAFRLSVKLTADGEKEIVGPLNPSK